MTLTDFEMWFAIDFGIICPNFRAIVKQMGAVWDFCGSSFYIGSSPLFSQLEWPYFSKWPYGTPDHPPLVATSNENSCVSGLRPSGLGLSGPCVALYGPFQSLAKPSKT